MRLRVRMSLAFLCAVLASAGASAATEDDSLVELRAKMDAAKGRPLVNAVETITATSDLGTTTTTTTYHRNDDVRRVTQRGATHTESGVLGGEHWRQNPNRVTIVETPLEPDPEIPKPLVTLARVTTPLAAYCITTDDRSGTFKREYVDPATFLTVREEESGSWGKRTTTYADFRTVGSQTLPMSWTTDDRHAVTVVRSTRTIDGIGSVEPRDVAEPPSRRTVFALPDTAAATLPATFARGWVFVRAEINGHAGDLLLDSGSAGIVLDTRWARSIGLTLADKMMNAANARVADQYSARVDTLRVGAARADDVAVAVSDLEHLADDAGPGHQVVGILGFDFFASGAVTIDYEHRTATMTPFATYRAPSSADTVALGVKLGNGVPTVPLTIEGHRTDGFMIDTGGGGGLFVFPGYHARHPDVGRLGAPEAMYGVGGAVPAQAVRFGTIQLGAVTFRDFRGTLATAGTSYATGPAGSIGTVFLDLFTVDFDYGNATVYLTPNANAHRAGYRETQRR